MRMSFLRISSLCSVARATVPPAREDRFEFGDRSQLTGASDLDGDAFQLRLGLFGGAYLQAIAQRGAFGGRPQALTKREPIELHDGSVGLVAEVAPDSVQFGNGASPLCFARRSPARERAGPIDQPLQQGGLLEGTSPRPSTAPSPYATRASGRFAVIRGSSCFSEPAAAFRGLERFLAGGFPLGIDASKTSQWQVDFAAEFQQGGTPSASAEGSGSCADWR